MKILCTPPKVKELKKISQLAYAIPPTPWVRRLHVGFSRSEGFTDGGVQKFWLVSGECRFAVGTSGAELNLTTIPKWGGGCQKPKTCLSAIEIIYKWPHFVGGAKSEKSS